jgi:hypothetical protein
MFRTVIGVGLRLWQPLLLIPALVAVEGCRRSQDVSGHNTYLSQPADTAAANETARDTAADTAAPRVRP